MNSLEKRSVQLLAVIMCLRMTGLFMVLPLFALYAGQLAGATPFLIGLSMGIYGLTQATFQIPFGALSDHVGRKKIIVLGLAIFILGSILCATSKSINTVILGRALQGAGAVGSTIMALVADLTRQSERTKAMAIIGMTIGMSFSLAMLAGPMLNPWIHVSGIFWLAAALSFIGILLLLAVPTPQKISWHADTEPDQHVFFAVLMHPELARLNWGIFLLHAIFTATFVILPVTLQNTAGLPENHQWYLYLPVLLAAFILCVPCIILAEKKHLLKQFFLGAIVTLGCAELLFWLFAKNIGLTAIALLLFFTAFSVLEGFLPSLVSKTAPPARKGTALGIYSCSQFLGIFVGGAGGGWLSGKFGLDSGFFCCAILTFFWMAIAFKMKNPQYR